MTAGSAGGFGAELVSCRVGRVAFWLLQGQRDDGAEQGDRLRVAWPSTACLPVQSAPQRLAKRPAQYLADGGQRDRVDHLHRLGDLVVGQAGADGLPKLLLAGAGA